MRASKTLQNVCFSSFYRFAGLSTVDTPSPLLSDDVLWFLDAVYVVSAVATAGQGRQVLVMSRDVFFLHGSNLFW
jgi:hypothetical protein